MARLFTYGAETNDISISALNNLERLNTGGTGTAPAVSTAAKRTGTYGFKFDSGAGNGTSFIDGVQTTIGIGATGYVRWYYYFVNLPTTTVKILDPSGSSISMISARLTSAGVLQLWNETGTPAQIGSDAVNTIVLNKWYRIEISLKIGSGAGDDAASLLLDGTVVASTTTATIGTLAWSIDSRAGWIQAPGANNVCYVDDGAVNDDSGANQNTYPGDGYVVLLIPTSDNARAALWTGGVGGTTNLFDAVNNLPPIGTATETDLTQIEHAGNSAGSTDAYDANMTTYIAAGLGSLDSITVMNLIAVHGEDITTGAKLLAFSVVSNPAIATSGNVTAGDSTPTLLGTYPSEWGFHYGTITYNPSGVVFGTAPVMRALRPETATRVASVCFMGIMVEYINMPIRHEILERSGSQFAAMMR